MAGPEQAAIVMNTTHLKLLTKRIAFLVTLTLAACMWPGCSASRSASGPGRRIVIGVSLLNLSNEFIVMLDQAMNEQAKQLGVELIVNDAQRSAEKQVQQAESFIAQKVDAIILNPCEVEASSPA